MGYTFYETWWGTLTKKLTTFLPLENVKEIYGYSRAILFLRLLVLIPVIVVATIYVSHRVAGPVFRIEKDLLEIGQGDFTRRIILRRKDAIKKTASAINSVINFLDIHLSSIKAEVARLHDSLNRARQKGLKPEEIGPYLEEWGRDLHKISQELKRFKTSS
jgi:methyl-accepting chemotaxis protein